MRHLFPILALAVAGCAPLSTPPPARHSQAAPDGIVPSETVPFSTATGAAPDALSRDDLVDAVVAAGNPQRGEALTSPDGQWRAQVVVYECTEVVPEETYAYQELQLLRAGEETAQAVDSQLIACGGLGAYGLATRFWSPNSRYLYYTDGATGVPDGCGYWTPPYKRIDTVGGQMEDLGLGMISPDGGLLAAWQGEQLGIWRVDGERMALLEIPTVARMPGALSWRPDSSALVFLISEGYCPLGETDLGRIDLAELRPIILLSYRDPTFADVAWDAPNRVTLTDEAGRLWRYNFLTRDLWPVGP